MLHFIRISMAIILTLQALGLSVISYCQITTTKIKEIKESPSNYDSLSNFLEKDVFKLKGQELYLKGKSEKRRQYGYDGFILDYNNTNGLDKSNIYKCCDGFNSKYNELTGKYFKVLDVFKNPKLCKDESDNCENFFFKLQEKESGDIVYYKYDSKYEFNYEFIIVGYFEKMRKLFIGKRFIFTDIYLENSKDIVTGKPITNTSGQEWKCTDLTIEEKYYNLVLIIENKLGEKKDISLDKDLLENRYGRMFFGEEADVFKKKFGNELFSQILKRNLKIGFTREMVMLAWGKPNKINETITSNKKSEQWIYPYNNLYFENDKLTAIQ